MKKWNIYEKQISIFFLVFSNLLATVSYSSTRWHPLVFKKRLLRNFLVIISVRPGSFPNINLEQLFCKEPVGTCFYKKEELHCRRYLRKYLKFYNTQFWRLQFVYLWFAKKELKSFFWNSSAPSGNFPIFSKFRWEFVFNGSATCSL